jgi:hypothetical protein
MGFTSRARPLAWPTLGNCYKRPSNADRKPVSSRRLVSWIQEQSAVLEKAEEAVDRRRRPHVAVAKALHAMRVDAGAKQQRRCRDGADRGGASGFRPERAAARLCDWLAGALVRVRHFGQ